MARWGLMRSFTFWSPLFDRAWRLRLLSTALHLHTFCPEKFLVSTVRYHRHRPISAWSPKTRPASRSPRYAKNRPSCTADLDEAGSSGLASSPQRFRGTGIRGTSVPMGVPGFPLEVWHAEGGEGGCEVCWRGTVRQARASSSRGSDGYQSTGGSR